MLIKEIPNYPGYHITETGEVISLFKGGRVLRPASTHRKYPYNTVVLIRGKERKTYYVHHLMANVFLGPPPFKGAIVRHLDGNSLNNNINNLAWGSYQDDRQDQKRLGTFLEGEKSPNAKLTREQVNAIREMTDIDNIHIAAFFSVSPTLISRVKNHKTYK